MQSSSRVPIVVAASIELFAIAIWAGGLTALGAVAAPLVFGIVPTPTSADAMSAVFLRFDAVAMTCAAIALVADAVLTRRSGPIARLDLVRGAALLVAGAAAIVEGAWISPTIAGLHRNGAIRGLGETGLALERMHKLAEAAGKTELVLLAVVLVLVVVKVSARDGTGVA